MWSFEVVNIHELWCLRETVKHSTETGRELSEMGSETLAIPKIDFTGLVPGSTGVWDAVQGEVTRALESYGCFEVLYDRVTPDLREALFSRAVPELFSLPVDVKKLNKYSDSPFKNYLEGSGYESLRIEDGDVEGFSRLMWPQGNPTFCNTVAAYISHLRDLEQITVRMFFNSLGVEKYYESYIESTEYAMRVSEYGVPFDQETKVSLPPHFDMNFVTIICQHQVKGLEVQTKEGEWIHVIPSSNSFTVMVGEAFEAWSNGRVQAPLHRVRTISNEKRNSVLFFASPNKDNLIEAPKELVDEEHPLVYKPYTSKDYLKLRYSNGGAGAMKTMKGLFGYSDGGTGALKTMKELYGV